MNDQSNSPQPADPLTDTPQLEPAAQGRGLGRAWERLVRLGLGEVALRIGTGLASIALILLVVWVMGNFYLKGKVNGSTQDAALAASLPTATAEARRTQAGRELAAPPQEAISRQAQLHTILPARPRFEITIYEVQKGDALHHRRKIQSQTRNVVIRQLSFTARQPA